jgi:phenylalanyl-tRNA synthetase beta subunit
MNILTNWLRHYLPTLPVTDRQLADDLTLRGIAVEGVHPLGPSVNGKPGGHLFEMDITTNRVDAMNHYGIAREAATIYNLPLSPLINDASSRPELRTPSNSINDASSRPEPRTPHNSINDASSRPEPKAEWRDPRISPESPQPSPERPFPITIEAPNLCGRFTAQVLRNITIAPSNGQVAEYFNLLGQKQISNAVDASNFVLLGMGHPTHAFDLDKLEGGIIVRPARKGEKLKLLDGTDRILEPDDLVVADEKKAVGLAGVMGGWDTMITSETKNILIEAAWFDPVSVRRSSRRHGLHTDASHRFERGADFNAPPIANALVSNLILQQGGHPEGALIDVIIPQIAARTASRPPIQLSVHQVRRHLGATVEDTATQSALTPALIHQYLTALGCTLTETPTPIAAPVPKESTVASRYPEPLASPIPGNLASRHAESSASPIPGDLASRYPEASASPSRGNLASKHAEPSASPIPGNLASRYPEASASGLSASGEERGFSPWGMPSSIPDTTFQVQLPSWRLDLEREIDLIEEVARVYGYNRFANNLPTPLPVLAHPTAAKESAIRNRLLALGYSESISSSFTSHHDADLFYTTDSAGAPSFAHLAKGGVSSEARPLSSHPAQNPPQPVPMENPLSEEASLLRPSLIPGMLSMLAHNLNRDVRDVRLFEQGQIFTGTIPPDSAIIDAVQESPQLSLGLTGSPTTTDRYTAQSPLFFELKGAIESVLSLFTPPGGPSAVTFTSEAPAWLEPGRAATALVNNQPIACFGELAHTQREARKLRQPVYLAQLDLAKLYELPLKKVTAHDLSRYQAVERDFSFILPDATQWHTIASAIHALAIPELLSLKPIEVWRDPKKFPGVYSLLLRTVFQSHDRTLRDDELTQWSTQIIETLTALGGTLRAA